MFNNWPLQLKCVFVSVCVCVCVCINVGACMCVCAANTCTSCMYCRFFHYIIFTLLDIGWLTSSLIQFTPIMDIDLLPFQIANTLPHTRTPTHRALKLTLTFFHRHSSQHPSGLCTFTLKAQQHQEGYIETCKWLLDIPVERLTVGWEGNKSLYISLDSQCKNELFGTPHCLTTVTATKLCVEFNRVLTHTVNHKRLINP